LLASTARADFDEEESRFPNDAYPIALRNRVNTALDRASHWLIRRQRPDGSWSHGRNRTYPMGPTALVTLALLKSGVPVDHPRIEQAFAYLRTLSLAKTYSVSILLMALDAKYAPARETFDEEEVDRYGHRRVTDPCAQNVTPEDLAWMKEAVRFLTENQANGVWRYPTGGFDLSNTQYALLGLKAAARCGVKIRRRVWLDALDALLACQQEEGPEVAVRVNEVRGDYRVEWTERARARGFGYVASTAPTASMTTAGLAGLLICQSELWNLRSFTGRLRQETRDAIRDGFAWMQTHFSVTGNPGGSGRWHYYYLYGLERAGILASTRFIGDHDWYAEGAEVLLAAQAADGSWIRGDVVNTCFAVLFLKRASFRTSNPAITPREPEPSPDGTLPGDR
jgi:hypothetical protein